MSKKILVSKDWHKKAMQVMKGHDETVAYVKGLQMFMMSKLTAKQQEELEDCIEKYLDNLT